MVKEYIERAILPDITLYVDKINSLAERDMIQECEIWINVIVKMRDFIGVNEK